VKHYTLTLVGTDPQNIRDTLIAGGDLDATLGGDHGFRFLSFQAGDQNATEVRVGDADLSDDDWGLWIPIPTTNVPAAPVFLGQYDAGPLKLSAIWVKGADGEKLHIAAVPF